MKLSESSSNKSIYLEREAVHPDGPPSSEVSSKPVFVKLENVKVIDLNKSALVIRKAVMQFLLLSLFILVVPLFVAIDALVLAQGVSERSLTEIAQEVLLFSAVVLFGASAWQRPEARGFMTLVAGFFLCMLIRELDVFFDAVHHGFWVWPASFVAIGTILFAKSRCGTVLVPMAAYVRTNSYTFLVVGVLALIFSRTFGSGKLLWHPIMGASYTPLFKAALQEGIELFGYVFIFYGSLLAKFSKDAYPSRNPTHLTRSVATPNSSSTIPFSR